MSRLSQELGRARRLTLGWALLLAVMLMLLVNLDLLPVLWWIWLAGLTLHGGFKLLSLLRLDSAQLHEFTVGRLTGYFLLWPGTRPQAFLDSNHANPTLSENRYLWIEGLIALVLGSLLLWSVPTGLPATWPVWLRAYFGLFGFFILLFFGIFDLLAAAWRAQGVPVEQLWHRPWHATTLAEFWGSRWNRPWAWFFRDLMWRPLRPVIGHSAAVMTVFAASGILHEFLFSVPARGGYGGPLLYFCLQGSLIVVEIFLGPLLLPRALSLRRAWILLAVVGPLPLLFHEPYLQAVIIPWLDLIGMEISALPTH